MAINYNDSRFTELEKDKQDALNQSNTMYDSLINQSQGYYDNLINQSKEYADKQAAIQNQQTEFAIDKIEQQKDKAAKDYTKEQKGAYQDYMKQSNAYGSNMQAAGQKGLGGSGWSETIQAGFYNTYQNRYAQARENYNTIVMNYDNNIKEAQLQNSSALLEIYNKAQQEQLELALQNFTVIKDLSLGKQNQYLAIDSEYNDRWRQVEAQINTENALAEEIRQYNLSLAEQKRQADMNQTYRISQSSVLDGGVELPNNNLTTAYWSGAYNQDALTNGQVDKSKVFSNGYQPNNVNGKKLTGTGEYIQKEGVTLQGTKTITTQQIWKTSDGTKYYWDGNQNKYIKYKG